MACSFYAEASGPDLQTAFSAVRAAAEERGHDPHAESLARIVGAILVDFEERTPGEAAVFARQLIRDSDQRLEGMTGLAGALRLTGSEPRWLFFGFTHC
ncbi:hypothetical protein ACX9I7_01210 [Streptomyces sp. L500]